MAGKKKKTKTKKELRQKIEGLEVKLKRALADYDNLEKRVLAQRKEFVKFAKAEVMDKLISVLDDLERAEEHLKDKGLSMAVYQFQAVLDSEGLEEIEAEGKGFDPEKMDCVSMVEGRKNRVISVLQKGYALSGKVIRPAKVEVGKGKN
jgi:molecular chaperone GrpE